MTTVKEKYLEAKKTHKEKISERDASTLLGRNEK